MNQLAIDFAAARAQRDTGMSQALNAAERLDDEWPELAYGFLCRYARTHEFFEGWQVTDEARRMGYAAPTTDRAWGALYVRAQREGVIQEAGSGRNPHRHNSICIRYRSMRYAGGAA